MRFKVFKFSYTFELTPSWVYHFRISGAILCFQLLYGWFQLSLLFHPTDLNIVTKLSWPQFPSCMSCFPEVGHKGYSRELFLLSFLSLTCICMYNSWENKQWIPLGTSNDQHWENKVIQAQEVIIICCCCNRCCY